MKRAIRTLARLYERLLRLYPRAYRQEYDEEMRSVFELAAEPVRGPPARCHSVGRTVLVSRDGNVRRGHHAVECRDVAASRAA
jgi:hypothetical protein